MTDRVRWTDDRIDDLILSVNRRVEALDKRLNSMPDRLTIVEMAVRASAEDAHECKDEIRKLADAWQTSRRGMSRGEKIALVGSAGGFIGALAAAVALLAGGGG